MEARSTAAAPRGGRAPKHRPVALAIVGAGAAGLFAAATAAQRRVGCLLFERKARIGSKLLMTANGRCNFTKDISPEQMLADLGEPVATFAATAIRRCPPSMIAAGFRARGLRTRRRQDGCIFPASDRAADVAHVFGDLLRDSETPLLTNCPVTGIHPADKGFVVETRGVDIIPRIFLSKIVSLARVQQQQRIFFSFFFFLFFFLFIRRGYGGNITFSCCFSYLFFLFFLNSGLVGRLLVTFCARLDGERIVIFIFTDGYECTFVGRLLVNYVAVNHFIDAAAQPTAINTVLISVVINAHLHAPPLVRFHKQEREEVPAPRVYEDPREKGFAVEVNVFAHNVSFCLFC